MRVRDFYTVVFGCGEYPRSLDQKARNLVPRSLVDEAEGEIWQRKKICFFLLAAPFDSCPIPSENLSGFPPQTFFKLKF